MEHPAIPSLPKNDYSNHGNNDDDHTHDQPGSRGVSSPHCLTCLLFLIMCGSLGCPSGFFFLAGFLRVSHSLPLFYHRDSAF
jgi:hypothetical protein